MSALTHVVVGTNDLERAREFYDAALSTLGLRRVRDFDRASMWGLETHDFMVAKPREWPSVEWWDGQLRGSDA